MLSVGAGLALGAGISAFGGAVTSWLNNRSISKENKIMREREDNAISRRVADLEASGLSPTLSAGSPASSQSGTPKNYDNLQGAFDFASKYLSLLQGKADISKTNSDVAMNDILMTSEKFKNAFVSAQTEGENLRNNWINADMMSKIGLNNSDTKKNAELIKEITSRTALLNAQSDYEQANTNYVLEKVNSERINQDLLMKQREWSDYTHASQVWHNYTSSKGGLMNMLGGVIGLTSQLEKTFPNLSFDKSRKMWYYPNRE